jgi:SAM-dependent methyltransferase
VPTVTREAAVEIVKNAAMAIPAVRALRMRKPRAGTRFTGDGEELELVVLQAFRSVVDNAGCMDGKRVLEIGPGDHLTVGIALLAAGADTYTSIDRFVGDYSRIEGKEWYAGIKAVWPRFSSTRAWPSWLDAADFPEAYHDRVRTLDLPVEAARGIGRFDVVCSFQVGEHVTDINAFAQATAEMLEPGGVGVHRIDFGPHGAWRKFDDPLTFLHVPESFWRLMSGNRGLMNRYRVHEHVAAMERAGLDVQIVSARTLEISARQLASLPAEYRQMPRESLSTLDAVLVCRRRD